MFTDSRRARPRRALTRVVAVVAASMLLATVAVVADGTTAPRAEAATGSDFNPGFIISDQNFYDASSMTGDQVQTFLQARGSASCTGATCLKHVRVDSQNRVADNVCRAYTGGRSVRFADVLSRVAAACGINPKVLLVTLEKEQSLITTSRSPSRSTLDRALGYGCPDTAACDPAFAGLDRQIYSAARQFKNYSVASDFFTWFPVGGTVSVSYQANAPSCGSSRVTIQNKATAALYYYTPYQPNAAALKNLYGTGDSCSAYGNRNFWRLFSDWFGSPIGRVDPRGALDAASLDGLGVARVSGWAADPDTAAPISVHLYVDGRATTSVRADRNRPDIARAYPEWGARHGYAATLTGLSAGTHQVCAYGINVSVGKNSLLGCRSVTTPTQPRGSVDSVRATGPGTVSLAGWAIDPNTTAPIRVHAYVDGRAVTSVPANGARPDIVSSVPGYGAAHGYSTTLTGLKPGDRRVCVYGINVGRGSNALLGCKTVSVPSGSPVGRLDSTTSPQKGVVKASGWALDPDTASSITVHLYIDGKPVLATPATGSRPDVAGAYPGYGAAHGYSASISGVAPGTRQVCAYGINVGVGKNIAIGSCKTVVVS
ncbi:hypothetical protein SOM11_00440 [Frigoribacterium sp. CFBP9039]|uniref:hypothetical protein n=1 Tax=Frigoribacterium sp. CFBP9029 TaxID=3096541 RepID=UPI002A69C985|nr:hypothetical protein [Frigoribacterium sp. CFBP9039]MDY0944453.1 hypothetical protein [Frigoribacterium sp. CFBP9039]